MMKNLETIALQVKKGMTDSKTAAFEIIRLVRKNKAYFKAHAMDPDDFNDFIVKELPHIMRLLEKFDPEKASFSTFFYRALKVSLFVYRRKLAVRKLDRESVICMKELLSEEMVYRYEQNEGVLSVEAACAEEELRQRMERLRNKKHACLMNRVQRQYYHSTRDERLEELRRSVCLILFLKSSAVVDDSSIRSTSIVTGISEDRLLSMVMELKEKIQKKLDRRDDAGRARDVAFFLRRRCRILVNQYNQEGSLSKNISDCYALQSRRWMKNNGKLAQDISIAPTNRDIGAMLNIPARKVARILRQAHLKFEQIRLDDADES